MDIDVRVRQEISRRRVIAGIAWSVPVIAAVSATPAFAASSGTPSPEPLPSGAVGELQIGCFSAWNMNEGGQRGPIGWAGGEIGWWSGSGAVTTGMITWIATITTPAGATHTIVTGARQITLASESITIPTQTWGTQPMAAGTYTITLTVTGAAGVSKSASTSIAI